MDRHRSTNAEGGEGWWLSDPLAPHGTRIGCEVPPGWDVFDAPDVVAVLRPRRDRGWFRTNVVLAHQLVSDAVTQEVVVGRVLAHLCDRHGEVELLGQSVGSAGDNAAAQIVTFETGSPAAQIAQFHASALEPTADSAAQHLYELVGTCLLDELEWHHDAFARITTTLRMSA